MRAIKAIALITALLSLACMVGCGLTVLSLVQTVADTVNGVSSSAMFDLSGVTSMEEVTQRLQQGTGAMQDQVNILTESIMDSQTQIIILFCGAVAFLLITMVLLVALKPERRRRSDYYEEY